MTAKTAAASFAVEVNEVGIFATGLGKDWWVENVIMRPIGGRITWLSMTPCGGIAQIPCEDREEAEFVRDHMVSHGIPVKFAKVKRVPDRERKGRSR
jgi:hypothetical protein